MCGIIAAFNYNENKKKIVNKFIINQYQKQIQRGTQGFGVIIIDKNNKIKIERSIRDSKAIADIYLNPTQKMIFHHRLPSSSDNTLKQTHPIEVESGTLKDKYYIIHNGVIENATERLLHQSEELGFDITTHEEEMANDSEALAIDIARFIEGQTKEIKSAGSAAFIAIRVDIETSKVLKIYYGRNTNPLKLAMTRGSIKLSSEGPGVKVKKDMLYSFDLEEYKISKKKMPIPTSPKQIGFQESKKEKENETTTQYKKEEKEELEKEKQMDEIDEKIECVAEMHKEQIEDELKYLIEQLTNRENLFTQTEDQLIADFLPVLIHQLKVLHIDAKDTFTKELIKDAEEQTKQPSLICQ